MTTPLRPHQDRALDMLRDSIRRGARRPLLWAPTGFGKTLVAATMAAGALQRSRRVAFVVPLSELVDQTVAAFRREGIQDIGVMAGNHPLRRDDAPVQIISAQTLGRRERPASDLIVIDECHLQFQAVTEWLAEAPGIGIGLSATPFSDGLGLTYDDLVRPATMAELTKAGFLAPFDVWTPASPNMAGVSSRGGEYASGEASVRMTRLDGDVIGAYLDRAAGERAVVFAVDLAHARSLTSRFIAANVIAEMIDGTMPRQDRAAIRGRLETGETDVVVSVNAIATGFDCPPVGVAILARPTKSAAVFVQQIGRVLRPFPGKDRALVLDLAGNHGRHGFVDEIEIKGLSCDESTAVTTGTRSPPTCRGCGALVRRGVVQCSACGDKLPQVRSVIEQSVPLEQLTRKEARQREQDYLGGLHHLAAERFYSSGWVARMYRDKFGRWPSARRKVDPIRPSPEVMRDFHAWKSTARARLRAR